MAKDFNRFPYTFAFSVLGVFWILLSESMYPLWVDIAFKTLGIIAVGVGVGGRLYSTLFIGGMKNEGVDGKTFIDYGPYSVTRNPLYFFSFVAFMGLLALQGQVLLLCVGAFLFYWIYRRTIKLEETFLSDKFGDSYRAYLDNVPQFFPRKIFETPEQILVRPKFLHKEIKHSVLWFLFASFLLLWQLLQTLGIVPILFFAP